LDQSGFGGRVALKESMLTSNVCIRNQEHEQQQVLALHGRRCTAESG